jgi:hypothetical protein
LVPQIKKREEVFDLNMELEKSIRMIGYWSKFMGYTTLIFGILQLFSGIFTLGIGSVIGIVQIFLGFYLIKSANEADKFLGNLSENNLNEMLTYLGKYMRLQGVSLILGISLFILGCLVFGSFMIAMIHESI